MKKIALIFFLILISTGSKPLQKETSGKDNDPENFIRAMFKDSLIKLKASSPIKKATSEENNDKIFVDIDDEIHFLDAITKEKFYLKHSKTDESNLQLESGGRLQYKISHKRNRIILEDLRPGGQDIMIDFKTNQSKIGDRLLFFEKKIKVDSNKNVFNSPWEGYSWKGSHNQEQLSLGRLQNGSVFIFIKTLEKAKELILTEDTQL